MKPDLLSRLAGYPVRVCQTMHGCALCPATIALGQRYHDGGYGRRAHVECVEPERGASKADAGAMSIGTETIRFPDGKARVTATKAMREKIAEALNRPAPPVIHAPQPSEDTAGREQEKAR